MEKTVRHRKTNFNTDEKKKKEEEEKKASSQKSDISHGFSQKKKKTFHFL